jgi:hypothetical protein
MLWKEELVRLNNVLSDEESSVMYTATIYAKKNTNAIIMPKIGAFDPASLAWDKNVPIDVERVLNVLIEKRILLEEKTEKDTNQEPRRIYLNPFIGFNGTFEKVNRYLSEKFGPLTFPSGGDAA